MKFLVDRMLGKLAKELRMLGYDTIYYRGEDIGRLIQLARQEDRVILTRNAKLLQRRFDVAVLRVTGDHPLLQLKELIEKGDIPLNEKAPFIRCLLCNSLLNEIPRDEVVGKVPDFILYQQKTFFQCPQCQRIYWQGSHQQHMQKRLDELLAGTQSEVTNTK
jgi:uncharacterized protein with PIN domain